MSRELMIRVAATTPAESLHEYDREVAGIYLALISPKASEEEAVSAALDGFHGTVPIKVLDDFSISVHDPASGDELEEDANAESGANEDLCAEVIGFIFGNTEIMDAAALYNRRNPFEDEQGEAPRG